MDLAWISQIGVIFGILLTYWFTINGAFFIIKSFFAAASEE